MTKKQAIIVKTLLAIGRDKNLSTEEARRAAQVVYLNEAFMGKYVFFINNNKNLEQVKDAYFDSLINFCKALLMLSNYSTHSDYIVVAPNTKLNGISSINEEHLEWDISAGYYKITADEDYLFGLYEELFGSSAALKEQLKCFDTAIPKDILRNATHEAVQYISGSVWECYFIESLVDTDRHVYVELTVEGVEDIVMEDYNNDKEKFLKDVADRKVDLDKKYMYIDKRVTGNHVFGTADTLEDILLSITNLDITVGTFLYQCSTDLVESDYKAIKSYLLDKMSLDNLLLWEDIR